MISTTATIQVVLDKKLLQATNQAARRARQNRSTFIREALRARLRQLEIKALEERDRAGYQCIPQDLAEIHMWEKVTVWPDE